MVALMHTNLKLGQKVALSAVAVLILGSLISPYFFKEGLSLRTLSGGGSEGGLRRVLQAFEVNPDLAAQAQSVNGGLQIGNEVVEAHVDEYSGQLVSIGRSRTFYTENPYKPEGPHIVRSEAQAKAVMAAFIRDAGVEMESYEFEDLKTLEGEDATQAAYGHARKVYTARFVERKSDPRFEATTSRSGFMVVDGQTGKLLSFNSVIMPAADPWQLNISEARAKEMALDAWRESGANIEGSQVNIRAKYVRTGNPLIIKPEDRLIPGYVLGASVGPDSWHCFAIIDGRSGKVMQSSCQIPNRMRGE